MKAIVRQDFGGPEQLIIQEVPRPEARSGEIVVRVRAFGLNRAEQYFREGIWGDVNAISGIECVGVVEEDGDGLMRRGQQVIGLMGGMGRTIPGSYAEYVRVPRQNVVAIDVDMPWEDLAALPESYATAWLCLHGNLALQPSQLLLIRGATSALGQAAINIAVNHGVRVLASARNDLKSELLRNLGVESIVKEDANLSMLIREQFHGGIDGVLDLVGNSSVIDSLKAVRRNARVCLAGFLGGGNPIESFQPLTEMPTGVHFSFFASAFVLGSSEYPLIEIPFNTILDRARLGVYQAKPQHVFEFEDIQTAHRLMDSHQALGKIVVKIRG